MTFDRGVRADARRRVLGSAHLRGWANTSIFVAGLAAFALPGSTAGAGTLREIADTFAGSAVARGQTEGIGVAIIKGDGQTRFFTYGNAIAGSAPTPFSPDSLVMIASVTKVFTTNLLGQAVAAGTLKLNKPLSQYQAQLGTLGPLTSKITLKQLGSFTAGIPDMAPLCSSSEPPVPGCVPRQWASFNQYPAKDFVAFFQNMEPENFFFNPPEPVTELPTSSFYSNYSVGLLGLLLGAQPGVPLTNDAVSGWFKQVRQQILQPLGMRNTFLTVPADRQTAASYTKAFAQAKVASGALTKISVISGGAGYSVPPAVTVVGGGGTGAAATATIARGVVKGITVTAAGQGYVAPPVITFAQSAGATPPLVEAIVSEGKIVGVSILEGGSGYQQPPAVTIKGGRAAGAGRNARLEVRIVNGAVSFVDVLDPGAGYVDPLTVSVAPQQAGREPVSILSPSALLTSNLRDISKFARAALNSSSNQDLLSQGFKIAQRPYACMAVANPDLAACPPTNSRSALAWVVHARDASRNVPPIISKDGALSRYSSFVTLMPKRNLAVVVFVNTGPGGEFTSTPAVRIGTNIMYALYYGCRQDGTCPAVSSSLGEE